MALDDFNRANGGLGSNWTTNTGTTAPRIVSNQGQCAASPGANGSGAYYNVLTPANDQYSSIVYKAGSDLGPTVRVSTSATSWYEFNYDAGTYTIWKAVAGVFTQLGASVAGTPSANDVMRVEVVGTTITGYINGVSKISRTDSTHTSGRAGFITYISTGAFDDFDAGSMSTALVFTSATASWAEAGALAAISAPLSGTSSTASWAGAGALTGAGSVALSGTSAASTGASAGTLGESSLALVFTSASASWAEAGSLATVSAPLDVPSATASWGEAGTLAAVTAALSGASAASSWGETTTGLGLALAGTIPASTWADGGSQPTGVTVALSGTSSASTWASSADLSSGLAGTPSVSSWAEAGTLAAVTAALSGTSATASWVEAGVLSGVTVALAGTSSSSSWAQAGTFVVNSGVLAGTASVSTWAEAGTLAAISAHLTGAAAASTWVESGTFQATAVTGPSPISFWNEAGTIHAVSAPLSATRPSSTWASSADITLGGGIALAGTAPHSTSTTSGTVRIGSLTLDRVTKWNPGLRAIGGIPARGTVFQTLHPLGGVLDDTAQIQAAINACPAGQVVALAAGTFRINNGNFVLLNKAITLRGAGTVRDNGLAGTLLYKSDGATPNSGFPGPHQTPVIIVGGARYAGLGPFVTTNLAADGAKGAYTISVASTIGFNVGDLVLLDEKSGATWQTDPQGRGQILASSDFRVTWQKHNPGQPTDDPIAYDAVTGVIGNGADAASWFCRQDRPTGEVKKIQAINGNTITFSTPLHIDYRTSHTAQIQRNEVDAVTRAGVENLTCKGGDDGNVRMNWTDECWLNNVESTAWLNEGIAIYRSFRPDIRVLNSHDACWPQPGGGGYAIAMMGASAEILIEDSISVLANKVVVSRCSGAGSVVASCYMDDGFINTNGDWQEIGVNASHMVGPHHVLFEDNWSFNGDSDHTHGNSIYMTYLRNNFTGVRSPFLNPANGVTYNDATGPSGPLRCVGLMAYTYWCSFLGNVLGRSGQMVGWTYEGTFLGGGKKVYMLGWDGWSPYPVDANVAATTIRYGNYDFVNNSQLFDADISGDVPVSLYLSGRPDFYTSGYTWPRVNPAAGTVGPLPAHDRFLSFTTQTLSGVPPFGQWAQDGNFVNGGNQALVKGSTDAVGTWHQAGTLTESSVALAGTRPVGTWAEAGTFAASPVLLIGTRAVSSWGEAGTLTAGAGGDLNAAEPFSTWAYGGVVAAAGAADLAFTSAHATWGASIDGFVQGFTSTRPGTQRYPQGARFRAQHLTAKFPRRKR